MVAVTGADTSLGSSAGFMGTTLINMLRGSDGGIAVEVRGEIDMANAERQVLTDTSHQRPTLLVVDCT